MGTSRVGVVDPPDLVVASVAVNQAVAGVTTLVAGQTGTRHKVDAALLTLSADGTLKFRSGTNDITGPMDIAAKGGFSFGRLGRLIQTNVGEALILETTLGAARGVVRVVSE